LTAEQATALIVAVTGLVAALGAIYAQLRQTHGLINGRMQELVDSTRLAAAKQGEMDGRDWARGINPRAQGEPGSAQVERVVDQ
jgi:hypothetical protein